MCIIKSGGIQMKYDFDLIEKKWQKKWADDGEFKIDGYVKTKILCA